MSSEHESASLLSSLQNTVKLLSALITKFEQREARMQGAIDQRVQFLQNTVTQLQHRVEGIVSGAKEQIAEQAEAAIVPVAAEYDRAVRATSGQVRSVGKAVWTWYGGLAGTAVVLGAVGWAVLGYWRREAAEAKAELARYENAVQTVQAVYASDAVVCDGRICIAVDPKAKRYGEKGQYRQAKSR